MNFEADTIADKYIPLSGQNVVGENIEINNITNETDNEINISQVETEENKPPFVPKVTEIKIPSPSA